MVFLLKIIFHYNKFPNDIKERKKEKKKFPGDDRIDGKTNKKSWLYSICYKSKVRAMRNVGRMEASVDEREMYDLDITLAVQSS